MVDPPVVATVDLYITCSRTLEIKIRNRISVRRVSSYSNSNVWYDPFKKLRPAENFRGELAISGGGSSPPPETCLAETLLSLLYVK